MSGAFAAGGAFVGGMMSKAQWVGTMFRFRFFPKGNQIVYSSCLIAPAPRSSSSTWRQLCSQSASPDRSFPSDLHDGRLSRVSKAGVLLSAGRQNETCAIDHPKHNP